MLCSSIMNKPFVLFVVGPTASGKTKLSIELAKRFSGEIISADSMQIYRGMDIGTAKPDEAERENIAHHLMDVCDIDTPFSVADYQSLAKEAVFDIASRDKLPIIVGGTGLYVDAVLYNTQFADHEDSSKLRARLTDELLENGCEYMHERLMKVDPESAAKLHPNDTKRVLRALECFELTGIPKSVHDLNSHKDDAFCRPLVIGLNYTDRELLYERINKRVDLLIKAGLIDEIRYLSNKGLRESATASQAIGYKEFYGYLDGTEDIATAIERLKQETRRYAKRQLTWFRRNKDINWINVDTDAGGSFDKVLSIASELVMKNIGE